jgi:hypothetical protein
MTLGENKDDGDLFRVGRCTTEMIQRNLFTFSAWHNRSQTHSDPLNSELKISQTVDTNV